MPHQRFQRFDSYLKRQVVWTLWKKMRYRFKHFLKSDPDLRVAAGLGKVRLST